MSDKLMKKLREDFPDEALSSDTSRGFELTSIKAMYVIERLNDVFGIFGWCYEWHGMEFRDGEWGCIVELRVLVEEDVRTIKQFGGKKVVRTNHTDAKKSAVTDGLTKCASMLGIGHSVFKGQQVSEAPPKIPTPKETDGKPNKTIGGATVAAHGFMIGLARKFWVDQEEADEKLIAHCQRRDPPKECTDELTSKEVWELTDWLKEKLGMD